MDTEDLELLRNRYYLMVGPLMLCLAVGLSSSAMLSWVSGIMLALLTINKLVGLLQRRQHAGPMNGKAQRQPPGDR
ncbi:hypothetical protein [Sphingomonas sp.]|uniref:hypothetical protein n=1 Tax=Sphingomonas sp. TaxID=28214 RepID=UPI0035A87252